MENRYDRLWQTEHEEVLVDNISKLIVNRNYIAQNQEFWDNTVFKLWEEYYFSSEPISIKSQARSLEVFMYNLILYKPALFLPKDVVEY